MFLDIYRICPGSGSVYVQYLSIRIWIRGFDFYHTNPDPRIRTQIRIAACKCIFSSLFVKHVDSKSALHVKSAHQNEAFFQDFFFSCRIARPGQ